MGFDLHWCLEIKTSRGWVGFTSSYAGNQLVGLRYYDFFRELWELHKNETGSHMPLRGLPDDISQLTACLVDEFYCWGDKGDNWCSVKEFIDAYNRAIQKSDNHSSNVDASKLFGLSYWPFTGPLRDQELRVVFAFNS